MNNANHVTNADTENGKAKVAEEEETMLPKEYPRRLTELCASIPLTDETRCGIGCFRGPLLQRFANKKAYVILYGILGCIFAASYSYFNGTITTLEKRFKIPSKTTGKSLTSSLSMTTEYWSLQVVRSLLISVIDIPLLGNVSLLHYFSSDKC